MTRINVMLLSLFLLSACFSEHESVLYSGDYRFHNGISEFFDCDSGVLYFMANQDEAETLQEKYLALKLKAKEDVFVNVEGYLKKESEQESLVPSTVFVATEFISIDASRGCQQGRRQGQ